MIMEPPSERTKRQKIPSGGLPGLPCGLWIVATPIGNLSDLAPRARLALEHADWIACEDTRRTRSLLSALGIPGSREGGGDRLRRFDRHTSPEVVQDWVREIDAAGQSVAVVSDAGTPGISDPGALLVKHAMEAGIRVTPVPGPSAVSAFLSVTGWPDADCFCFQGFLPRQRKALEETLSTTSEWAQGTGRAWISVWFESPERVGESLEAIASLFPDAEGLEVAACKELTKVHEHLFRGSPSQVSAAVSEEVEHEGALGEWAIAIKFPAVDARVSEPASSEEWGSALECLQDAGVKDSESARIISHRFGVSREDAYRRALDFKKNRRGG
jgi:16S rRNA (cytidine1402-2'-O)-methyltransferase